ncbi:MAG: TIM barrel protein [Candidatus Aenigmatarchaeota archaeon]
MKIRLGPSGVPFSCESKTSIDGIKMVAELGLTAMEVPFTHGIRMSLESAKVFGEIAKELGIELSIHAPYYINLASEDEKIIDASKKRIIDSLARGVAMNATIVVAHAGFYGKDKEKSKRMILDACTEIDGIISDSRWNIQFGLETMGKQASFGTLEEIIAVCKNLKHTVPYLDPSHIYARNGGVIDYKQMLDLMESLKLEKIHSHFSGIKYSLVGIGRGNEKKHVPMKEAGPDFDVYAKEILKRNMDITIISESPVLEMDSLLMKNNLEEMGYKF